MASPRDITKADKENPKPIYAVWETTMRCDHSCSHCGSRAEFSRPNELTTEELYDVADQLIRLVGHSLRFFPVAAQLPHRISPKLRATYG